MSRARDPAPLVQVRPSISRDLIFFRRQPISTILHQLVVEGAPGCLALLALRLRRFAIIGHGVRAQIWINKWPHSGPHCGHGRCSPAVTEPDILEPGKVLNFAHDSGHLGSSLPFCVDMLHEKGRQPSKGGACFFLDLTSQRFTS